MFYFCNDRNEANFFSLMMNDIPDVEILGPTGPSTNPVS